jgi:hypothetical protein
MSMRRLRRSTAVVALAGVVVLLPAPSDAATLDETAVPNHKIVNGWYRDFLHRSPENLEADYGRDHWIERLNTGEPRSAVLGDIVRSSEYATRRVGDSYQAILGRKPDPGASYWVEGVSQRGMALEWVDQNLLASQELHSRWAARPNGDDLYVQQLYVHVLGRYAWETTPGERAYWAGRIRAVGRLAAVRELWYADEAVRHRLAGHYISLLGYRGVDRDGLHYWYPREVTSDLTTRVAIASTDEYADYVAQELRITFDRLITSGDKTKAVFTVTFGRETYPIDKAEGEPFGAAEPLSLFQLVGVDASGNTVTVRFNGDLEELVKGKEEVLGYP